MHVYQDPNEGFKKPRAHPFISIRDGESGFIDFKRHPEQIAVVLEDFVVHGHEPAIQAFYNFLAWLNGPDSLLESCDCALRGPEPHRLKFSKRKRCIHGRLMLMYRDLPANCDDRANLLYNTLGRELTAIDPDFSRVQGVVAFAGSQAVFSEVAATHAGDSNKVCHFGGPGFGYQTMLLYRAFGHDDQDVFKSLERVFRNIEQACRNASERIGALKTPSG